MNSIICFLSKILSLFSEHLWMALKTSELAEGNFYTVKRTGACKMELLILMKCNLKINLFFS